MVILEDGTTVMSIIGAENLIMEAVAVTQIRLKREKIVRLNAVQIFCHSEDSTKSVEHLNFFSGFLRNPIS